VNYHPLLKREGLIILQGLLLLALIIFTGVGVAQHQLGNLTQKNEAAGIYLYSFDLDKGYRYLAYAGEHLERFYNFLNTETTKTVLSFRPKEYQSAIPVWFNFETEIGQIKSQLEPAYLSFKEFAYMAKSYIEEKTKEIIQYIPVFN